MVKTREIDTNITPGERALQFRNQLNELEKQLPEGALTIVVNDWLNNEATGFNVFVHLKMGNVNSAAFNTKGSYYWLRPGSDTETVQPWREAKTAPYFLNKLSPAIKRLFNDCPNIRVRKYNSPQRRAFYDAVEVKTINLGYYSDYISFDLDFKTDGDFYR